jgi:hypothetical protein
MAVAAVPVLSRLTVHLTSGAYSSSRSRVRTLTGNPNRWAARTPDRAPRANACWSRCVWARTVRRAFAEDAAGTARIGTANAAHAQGEGDGAARTGDIVEAFLRVAVEMGSAATAVGAADGAAGGRDDHEGVVLVEDIVDPKLRDVGEEERREVHGGGPVRDAEWQRAADPRIARSAVWVIRETGCTGNAAEPYRFLRQAGTRGAECSITRVVRATE